MESPRNSQELLGAYLDAYGETYRRMRPAWHQLGRHDLFPTPIDIDWWWDVVIAATLKE